MTPSSPQGFEQGWLRAALQHHDAGRLPEAEALYRRILAKAPGHPHALHLLGLVAHQRGRNEQAAELIEQAIAASDSNPAYHGNLGLAYEALGRYPEAIASQQRALRLKPDYVQAYMNLGSIWAAAGHQAHAVEAYERALKIAPRNAAALGGMGRVLKAAGEPARAAAAFRQALEIDPADAETRANLGLALFDEANLEPAAQALEQALGRDSGLAMASFYLATIRALQGDANAAEELFARAEKSLPAYAAMKDSWDYVTAKRDPETQLLGSVFDTLDLGLAAAKLSGLVLEFGVRFGTSIRHIAAIAAQEVHGFDSFEGLPEAWGDKPSGVYTTGGALPEVPSNVRLHAGWFEDTLPGFADEHSGPVRFMNVDCDIYSSTKTILDVLGGRIVPGSVIVFDEYIMTSQWRKDEYLAFQEAVVQRGWGYRYLAFSHITRQAAVVIQ